MAQAMYQQQSQQASANPNGQTSQDDDNVVDADFKPKN